MLSTRLLPHPVAAIPQNLAYLPGRNPLEAPPGEPVGDLGRTEGIWHAILNIVCRTIFKHHLETHFMKLIEPRIEVADALTRSAIKVWLIGEVVQKFELEKESPDLELIEACKACGSVCLRSVGILLKDETLEITSILMLSAMKIEEIIRPYDDIEGEVLKYWISTCVNCCQVFQEHCVAVSLN